MSARTSRQWRTPTLSRGRFLTTSGFVVPVPALAWRRINKWSMAPLPSKMAAILASV